MKQTGKHLAIHDWEKGGLLYEKMVEHQSVNIRQISKNGAEQIVNYRFLENDNVTIID